MKITKIEVVVLVVIVILSVFVVFSVNRVSHDTEQLIINVEKKGLKNIVRDIWEGDSTQK